MDRSQPATVRSVPTVRSVQYLRAVAAIAVVVYHGALAIGKAHVWPVSVLSGGVDVFFVISGFIMWSTTFGRPTTPTQFWKRRLERIVPLYWLITTVAVAAAVVSPTLGGVTSTWHVISSYLFVPAVNPDSGHIEPIVSPGWTLNYEMFFYLLFGIALTVRPSRRVAALGVGLVGAVVICAGAPDTLLTDFYGNTIILEFGFGLALGWLSTKSSVSVGHRPALVCGAASLILFAALGHTDLSRVIGFGVPALLLVSAAVLSERRAPWADLQLPRLLGDASYSIYICHGLIITGSAKVFEKVGVPAAVTVTVGPVLAITFGVAVYRYVESPIQRHFKDRRRLSETATAIA